MGDFRWLANLERILYERIWEHWGWSYKNKARGASNTVSEDNNADDELVAATTNDDDQMEPDTQQAE